MARLCQPSLPFRPRIRPRSIALLAAAVAAPPAAAVAFALSYRRHAGLPHPRPIAQTPGDLGLPCEEVTIRSTAGPLGGWFIPAAATGDPLGVPAEGSRRLARGPAAVIVHGWESNRGASLPHVQFLRAAGFHCLVFDVRGHGANPRERRAMSIPEFAADTAAASRWLAARPETSAVGVLGHSMGGGGAIVAAAGETAIGAVVAVAAPADPVRLTRQTFRLAGLPLPEPLAMPLAWLTIRVLLAARGHTPDEASPRLAAGRYHGPLLLVHGELDRAVPVGELSLVARAALAARWAATVPAPLETLVLAGFGHRWLYESPLYRQAVARFLARALGGLEPGEAGRRAAAVQVDRPPQVSDGFGALTAGRWLRPLRREPPSTLQPQPSATTSASS